VPAHEDEINRDRLYSPGQVAQLENISLASVYLRLGRGEYTAFKDGAKTQIPGSTILERRRTKLKPAEFKTLPAPQLQTTS
jgi:hypothetical protein